MVLYNNILTKKMTSKEDRKDIPIPKYFFM